RDIGVEANADVLDVEHEHINVCQHGGRWPAAGSVEAMNGNAGVGVDPATHRGSGFGLAAEAVLGGQDGSEFEVRCSAQQVGQMLRPDQARLVGDEAHPLALERREARCGENLRADRDALRQMGLRLGRHRHHRSAQRSKQEAQDRASGQYLAISRWRSARLAQCALVRVSMKTAFSPIRLCTVRGSQVPSCWPEALKATARSTRAFTTTHRLAKSLMVQRCALGLTYQASGRFSVTGMRPVNSSWARTCQWPKLGNETMALRPMRRRCSSTVLGCRVAWMVRLRMAQSKASSG